MGKFKEKAIELMNVNGEQSKQEQCDLLVVQYPALTMFIRECFILGEEHKLYELLFSLETDASC